MRSSWFLAPVLCAFAVGCVENDQSLVIEKMVPFDSGSECSADAQTSKVLARGIFDVGVYEAAGYAYGGYNVAVVVSNGLPTPTNENLTNNILVEGMDVSIELPQSLWRALPGGGIPTESTYRQAYEITVNGKPTGQNQLQFFVPSAAGLLLSGGSSKSVVVADVIPPALIDEWVTMIPADPTVEPKQAFLKLRVKGSRSGDVIRSGTLNFPLAVCHNCLVPPKAPCGAGGLGIPAESIVVGGCFPQQEQPSTCCTNSAGVYVCGGDVPVAK